MQGLPVFCVVCVSAGQLHHKPFPLTSYWTGMHIPIERLWRQAGENQDKADTTCKSI
jgi:hypothetical protein